MAQEMLSRGQGMGYRVVTRKWDRAYGSQ